jgi:hypothetical protein
MVIKTTRHDNRLNRTLFNYTDWQPIRGCPCPLMLVKSAEVWETRRIVACVDPAHTHSQVETLDDCIIDTAQMLAYRLRGELHVFHSIEILPEPAFLLLWPGSNYGKTPKAGYQPAGTPQRAGTTGAGRCPVSLSLTARSNASSLGGQWHPSGRSAPSRFRGERRGCGPVRRQQA